MTGGTATWPMKRLGLVAKVRARSVVGEPLDDAQDVTFLPMDAIGKRGDVDVSSIRPVADVKSGYSRFSEGDVVIAKITPCFENGKGALIRGTATGIGFGTTELHVVTPGPGLDGRFLYYVTVQPKFRRLGKAWMIGAAGQQRVPEEFVRDFPLRVPSISRQREIADYLDRATARIDGLISAKQHQMELTTEKYHAFVAGAVTRGLEPNAPVRDSGLGWLGWVPAHWETKKVAWLFRERDQRGCPHLPLLEVSINSGVVLREFSKEHIEGTAADFNTYKVARRHDIVFNKMRMWQGAVGAAPVDGLVSPDYVVASPIGTMTARYAELLFRTRMFSAECARRSHGIVWDRLRLYWEGFRDIEVCVPSPEEQAAMVHHVRDIGEKLDSLTFATRRSVNLLEERRSALIAAAVSGKIDVDHVA